ncbi:insulinase family protein [Dactylosporangium sp. NPDC048998]|uniref:insulinase family protein n=1 Tax=Dactylosporangium sp. NPDC048998 TaxID=3363976 RepID=UPI0037202A98
MTIRQLEVDGVPALFVEYSGPTIAGLTFRVGQADESLPYRGITHLLEHLVLHGHGLTDYHYNGSTGPVATTFHLQGGEDDIVAYLAGVCASLRALPLDRLDTERQVLRAEEGGRRESPAEALALWRYGARTYGLPAYTEMGLPRITGNDLWYWVQTWFTRQNAALWLAGERIPPALRLPLLDGQRRLVPAPTSALRGTPAYFVGNGEHVAYDGIVRRGVAGSMLSGVLERELYRSLRQEDGNSYTAASAYAARGDGRATVMAVADSVPGKQDAVLGGFVDVLARLRAGRLAQADLDAVRAKAEDAMRGPMAEAGRLPARALDLLTGAPLRSIEELRAEMAALSLADVHAAALEMLDSGLLQVPAGHTADWAGFEAAPTASDRQVDGARFPSLDDPAVTLVVGALGVGLDVEGCPPCVVSYAECAIALAYPDGGRHLIGFDGLNVRIEPTIHPVPPEALRHIDASVAGVLVRQPPRDPRQIPAPRPAPPVDPTAGLRGLPLVTLPGTPAARAAAERRSTPLLVGAVAALVLAGVLLCCSGLFTAMVADNSDPETDIPLDAGAITIMVLGYGGMLVLAAIGVYLLRRRSRK